MVIPLACATISILLATLIVTGILTRGREADFFSDLFILCGGKDNFAGLAFKYFNKKVGHFYVLSIGQGSKLVIQLAVYSRT